MRVATLWLPNLLPLAIGLGLATGLAAILPGGPAESGVLDASWTAPTTNTDGSPLTDLGSYRVYYGSATGPCPGPTWFSVASPTTSPGPNQTVSFRLTGLTTGALYYVSVSAVDLNGNQSACSIVAGGTAQANFSVSPSSTVNFGSVNVGSFAEQVFTVQNTRGGTVSGGASVSAPFSIVSGSPFTLVGSGTTQAVKVRFTPTTSATVSTNVKFTADGDTISRLVTGTGVGGLDTTRPIVTITSPTSNSTYATNSFSLTLRGTASDNVGVTQVTWSNSLGGSGTATGTTSWAVSGIVLRAGSNVLTVRARDVAGNVATDTLTVTLSTAGTFAFTDSPLTARSTLVKALHFTELRSAIDTKRASRGLAPFAWTDPTLTRGSTRVRLVHLTELRAALTQAYRAAGRTAPTYTDPSPVAGATPIKAIHLNELRAAVNGL